MTRTGATKGVLRRTTVWDTTRSTSGSLDGSFCKPPMALVTITSARARVVASTIWTVPLLSLWHVWSTIGSSGLLLGRTRSSNIELAPLTTGSRDSSRFGKIVHSTDFCHHDWVKILGLEVLDRVLSSIAQEASTFRSSMRVFVGNHGLEMSTGLLVERPEACNLRLHFGGAPGIVGRFHRSRLCGCGLTALAVARNFEAFDA